jgi:hypothetical protein
MNGNLEIFIYAHTHGCPWDEWTCLYAAKNGNLEILKYAHTNGCPWDEETCLEAAKNGHLDCLTYAHENECPWNRLICYFSASKGHLECFKYAHENGCQWNKQECLKIAIEKNKTLIVEYIKNLQIENEEEEEDKVFDNEVLILNCESCKVNKKCVVYQPCNHLLSCWSCAIKTENCSNCNVKISNFFKIFFQ